MLYCVGDSSPRTHSNIEMGEGGGLDVIYAMGDFSYRLYFDQGKKNEIQHLERAS